MFMSITTQNVCECTFPYAVGATSIDFLYVMDIFKKYSGHSGVKGFYPKNYFFPCNYVF